MCPCGPLIPVTSSLDQTPDLAGLARRSRKGLGLSRVWGSRAGHPPLSTRLLSPPNLEVSRKPQFPHRFGIPWHKRLKDAMGHTDWLSKVSGDIDIFWCHIRVILGLYGDNGKEHGNYHSLVLGVCSLHWKAKPRCVQRNPIPNAFPSFRPVLRFLLGQSNEFLRVSKLWYLRLGHENKHPPLIVGLGTLGIITHVPDSSDPFTSI